MKAKEYLFQLRNLKSKQRNVEEKIRALEAAMMSAGAIRYDKVNVQVSPEDPMVNNIVRLTELKSRLEDLQMHYIDLFTEIMYRLNNLDAIQLKKDILYLRYVEGMPFWKIAQEMNYDQKYITNLHGIALKEFTEQWLT